MDESERVVTRGWLLTLIGTALLAGALLGLFFSVFLSSYDRYGVQIKCGNGYSAELLQATIGDQEQHSAPVGASQRVGPATNYVDQCKTALAHRRAWLVTVAAIGLFILAPQVVAWSRAGEPDATGNADSTDLNRSNHETGLVSASGSKRRVVQDRRQ